MLKRRGLKIVALGAVLAGLTAAVLAPAVAARTSAAEAKITIAVVATEFKYALSKTSVRAGTVATFAVTNKGAIEHDFAIGGKKTAILKTGKKGTVTVAFPKKGSFPYLCTVPGHAGAGMKGVFKVT